MNRIKTMILISFLSFIAIESYAQETEKINDVLEQKRTYTKKHPTGMGYRIQLYNGDETSAYRIKNKFEVEFNLKATLLYESPEWKVRVGNYSTRLDADRALLEIKQKFTGAIVLKTEIRL